MKRPRKFRNRVIVIVSAMTLAVSLVFSFYTLVFIYEVEDAFFSAQLEEEAEHLRSNYDRTGAWVKPGKPAIRLYLDNAMLPTVIRNGLDAEPERVEFSGPGSSHFHLQKLEIDGISGWLVYDVGSELVVKPMRNSLLWLLACTTTVLVGLALLAGYWASRKTTRRLEQLAKTAGDLDPAHLPDSWAQSEDGDEVSRVAAGLDAMTTRLKEFVARERGFTRDASHELRTPLAVIRSASDQLVNQQDLGELSRLHADLIRESTARLEQTVNILLVMAREEASDRPETGVHVLPLIEQCVLDQSPRLDGKNVSVEVSVSETARMHAPAAVTRIVLANLIGNAFAHTVAGTVRISSHGGLIRITNPLSGDPHDMEGSRAFASSSETGFGFGLAIARRLCQRFNLDFKLVLEGNQVIATLALMEGR